MNLIVLLALKRAHDMQVESQRRSRRLREEVLRKKKAPKYSYGSGSRSYSSKEYSEVEYFSKVITEDEVLTVFFKAIDKKGLEIDEKDAEVIRKKVEEKLEAQAKRVDEIDKVHKELIDTGLNVRRNDYSNSYYNTTVGQKVIEAGQRAFGDKGEYASVKRSFKLEYKGIELAKEWFTGESKSRNPFGMRYDAWEKENPEIDAKIAEKEAEIQVQERKIKHALFKKDEKQDELIKMQKELDELKRKKAYGDEIKIKRDIFAEITPEQKDILERYFSLVDVCKEKGKEVDTDIEEYRKIKDTSYYYYGSKKKSAEDRNKWARVIEELKAEGDISEELLDAVDTILSEESIGYEKYYDGKDEYQIEREGFTKTFTEVIGWYLDTRREKIALKGVERREQAYTALKEEHKKLCDLAGLVDKAEEIEDGKKQDVKGVEEYGE